MRPRHVVLTAGIALALAGAPMVAGMAYADSAEPYTSDEQAGAVEYDKADFYEEAPVSMVARSMSSARASNLSPVDVSAEMKYFTEYESHANYRQGFGYGDGYNALGYYQFDRRYSLIEFIGAVYAYDPVTYSMFEEVLERGSEISDPSTKMYDAKTGKLTELGRLTQDAWYAAYDADPEEFSALQDSYAYNSYYVPTERWLAAQGIDISGRADCVKGMVWGLSNLWGTGGVRSLLLGAGLSNDMTDREFVTALSQQMTDHIEDYSSQTEYYAGWKRRYADELADCLAFIAEDEAAAAEEETPEPEQPEQPEQEPTPQPEQPGEDDSSNNDPSSDGSSGSEQEDPGQTGSASSGTEQGSQPSGDSGAQPSGDSDDDVEGSDDVTPSVVPSRPNQVPPSNAVSGTTTSKPNDAPSSSTTATDGATSSDNEDGDAATDDSTSEKKSGEKAGEKTSDSQKQADQTENADKRSNESDAAGGDDADVHPNGVMPQTSDLIMLTCFASASLACFGATSIYAGKRSLSEHGGEDVDEA